MVFDEVQKVIPHTLDGTSLYFLRTRCKLGIVVYNATSCVDACNTVFMEAVSSRAQLSYYKGSAIKTLDTSNVSSCWVLNG